MKIIGIEPGKEKILLVSKSIPSRMLAFTWSVLSFPIRHRKFAYDIFSRYGWLFFGFELLGIGLLASKLYLYGDGLDCVMEGIQNEQQAKNETYLEMLRSFCTVYGHPPEYNETSKNETFIQSLDYFIATGKEKDEILVNNALDSVSLICFVHLTYFLIGNTHQIISAEPRLYEILQIFSIMLGIFFTKKAIFMTTDIFIAANPEIFQLTESDSLLQFSTVLKLYWTISVLAICIMAATYFGTALGFVEQGGKLTREGEEFTRWILLFEKLKRIYKAIGREASFKMKNFKREPSTGIHSFKFNLMVLSLMAFAFFFELSLPLTSAFKEAVLGSQVDCILEGIKNEAQANSEPYRELVRNTCGMIGVPPNYMRFKHGNDSFFMRIPEVNHENETFDGKPDYSYIRREEELHRKPLVLALAFLFLLQLLILKKIWSSDYHILFPSFKFMVVQIIFLTLALLICVLCKNLTFGQTSLFSPDRTVFRGERQALPILWYDLPKTEPESHASLLSYLISHPKLDSEHVQLNNTKELPLIESIAHQPHSDNKIYLGPYKQNNAFDGFSWYIRIWLTGLCLCVLSIIARISQMVHLLVQGKLFTYMAMKRSSPEEKWNWVLEDLDEICDVLEGHEEDDEDDQKERLSLVVSVSGTETDQNEKTV